MPNTCEFNECDGRGFIRLPNGRCEPCKCDVKLEVFYVTAILNMDFDVSKDPNQKTLLGGLNG